MLFTREFNCRQANPNDLREILNGLKLFFVQQHLDWESIPDQIRTGKMYLCHSNNELAGILSISGLQPDNQWVKVFAVGKEAQKYLLWNKLLSEIFRQDHTSQFYTIAYWDWFKRLVHQANGFELFDEIVTLEKVDMFGLSYKHPSNTNHIRRITEDDLEVIFSIDQDAFTPPWQLDIQNISAAIDQSEIALAVIQNNLVVGYLLCDHQDFSAHLSRIAISPVYTRKNLASNLINSLLNELSDLAVTTISVNTQASNTASLNLYKKFGFVSTGETIPTYQYICPDFLHSAD